MVWTERDRKARRLEISNDDERSRFERDRDRLLYSSAFQRLSGITQIVRAGEADVFHTRQQHTIKVAQIGRRVAQHCIREQGAASARHGIDPEVVEAACLAHDLGHPPFGHIGEHELNKLCREYGAPNGFEGNAQSFRIVTKLAVRFDEDGLDLTRATLAALLKYPWLREEGNPDRCKKWSVYDSENEDFIFARKYHPNADQTAEAALMDWADDIAYSVHDLEDFHRCGAIPWPEIFEPSAEAACVARAASRWHGRPPGAEGELRTAFRRLKEVFELILGDLLYRPYDGSRAHRLSLRTLTAQLIGRYVPATKLSEEPGGHPLVTDPEVLVEVRILKQITWDYIISNPSLSAQQHGQKRIVAGLFDALMEGSTNNSYPSFLPIKLRYLWPLSQDCPARFAADCIASLTEKQATALYGRLYGSSAGSVLDPIVR